MLDVAIIGAGPAGLTAAIYAARGNNETTVFGDPYDSQLARGGTFENLPGYPDGVLGLDLVDDSLDQAEKYGAETVEPRVTSLERSDHFVLETEDDTYEARAAILATGATHRQMDIEGEEEFEHRGISYCAYCDGPGYDGDTVAVVGYGNGAAKAAIQLKEIAAEVHVVSPWSSLRSEETYEDRLAEAGNVELHLDAEPAALRGDDRLEVLEYERGGETRSVEVDGVFVEYGMEPNSDLAEQVGAATTGKGYVEVERPSMATGVDGFYAAGDVTGGMKQAATAIGEGASAAITAMDNLED